FPPSNQRRLELAVSHEDYASRKMAWDLKAGDQVPATYTFKLGGALTIGGVVVNRSSQPGMDATLNVWRYWSGRDRQGFQAGAAVTGRIPKASRRISQLALSVPIPAACGS